MKKSLLSLLILCMSTAMVMAQENQKFAPLDSSPVDLVYYPLNATKVKDTQPIVKVTYSRPHKKGRIIFGGLEQYGKVWRVGANENTEIKFFKDVKIGGKKVKKGSYGLFAIPDKTEWVFIISKQNDTWGAYSYNQSMDVVRVKVPVTEVKTPIEDLSITFENKGNQVDMVLGWDNVETRMPITID